MKRLFLPCLLVALFAVPETAMAQETKPAVLTPIMVQDFEKPNARARVWVVNVPNDFASVELVPRPFQGRQSLQLRYRLAQSGQYLGVAVPVKILAPIRHLHAMVNGDGSGSAFAVYFTDAGGETHKYRPATNTIDFKGWKPIEVDVSASHEIWGGDKNLKIDYPIREITFEIAHRGEAPVNSELSFDAIRVDSEMGVLETLGAQISVMSPAYGADVEGNARVVVSAPGFQRLTVRSWKAGGAFGTDSVVANVSLDKEGRGAFVYPTKSFPHGPNTLTISGENGAFKDNCYLQLYNRSGVSWNEGMPASPPAAKGMKLVFADDFNKPLSISSTDSKATYYSHKPPNGSQDFSSLPFSDFESARNPFFQRDSYLRIRADEGKNSSGLLSSLHNNASGIKASAPCYFECRLLGPNAVGTWPAFWLMTDYLSEIKRGTPENTVPVDELDIIEAYGGEGPGSPNAKDTYMIMPHAWNQGEAGRAAEKVAVEAVRNPASMKKFGIPSTWYEAFHVYGCKITPTNTIYYCDNKEVARHKTLDASKKFPFFFMINLATGGGWPVDLSRYDGRADMYVDYVRVYAEK